MRHIEFKVWLRSRAKQEAAKRGVELLLGQEDLEPDIREAAEAIARDCRRELSRRKRQKAEQLKGEMDDLRRTAGYTVRASDVAPVARRAVRRYVQMAIGFKS